MELTGSQALGPKRTKQGHNKLRTHCGLESGNGYAIHGAYFERLGGGGDRGEVRDVITAEDLGT